MIIRSTWLFELFTPPNYQKKRNCLCMQFFFFSSTTPQRLLARDSLFQIATRPYTEDNNPLPLETEKRRLFFQGPPGSQLTTLPSSVGPFCFFCFFLLLPPLPQPKSQDHKKSPYPIFLACNEIPAAIFKGTLPPTLWRRNSSP